MTRVHLLALALLAGSCGEADANLGMGEPCVRTIQCGDGLACVGGVCTNDVSAIGDPGAMPGTDGGSPPEDDAGPATDAGPGIDSGPLPDSGPPPDAGPEDAGFDAGGGGDAGTDAGPADAGFDAGPTDAGVDGSIDVGLDSGV